jgi:malic enzyme
MAVRLASRCENLRARVAEAEDLPCNPNDVRRTAAVVLADLDPGAQTARSLVHFSIGIASGCGSGGIYALDLLKALLPTEWVENRLQGVETP